MSTVTKMKKTPLLNAVSAAIYIITVVLVMSTIVDQEKGGNIMVPMVALSLFTLSAAVMGYLFLAEPLMLYFDGKKKEAVEFFLQTVFIFGGITLLILLVSRFIF